MRMAILIRTSDVPPAQRHDAWRSVVCDTLGPLDFRSDPDTPLRGEIAAGQLGPVSVGRVKTSTPHSVYRTPGLIRRDSPELYRVALAMSGQACLLQDGRAARLRPGEFAIYDFTRPYELAYDSGVQLAVFSFPRETLALPIYAELTIEQQELVVQNIALALGRTARRSLQSRIPRPKFLSTPVHSSVRGRIDAE